MSARRPLTIGVSHKMYFSHAETVRWTREVAAIAERHPGVLAGRIRLFAVPQHPSIPASLEIAAGTPVEIGAQNCAAQDSGAFTGEVSPRLLAELGATLVEVGHAERRMLFGESDETIRAKTAAITRNHLTPIICVGEAQRDTPQGASETVLAQLASALRDVDGAGHRLVVAYEPIWAIGAAEPAPPAHIAEVVRTLRAATANESRFADIAFIYGGSAQPGLLTRTGDAVDGLFLGRFAHDTAALEQILDEASALVVR